MLFKCASGLCVKFVSFHILHAIGDVAVLGKYFYLVCTFYCEKIGLCRLVRSYPIAIYPAYCPQFGCQKTFPIRTATLAVETVI